MFYEIVEANKEPTAFQLARLRSYELTSRINSVIFEAVDFGTDLAFLLVLFDQAGSINLAGSWQFYKATSRCAGLPPGGPDPDFYFNLGVASAVFLALSFGARLATSLGTIYTKYSEISGTKEWLWILLGTAVSIVHPWNGALIMNRVFEEKRIERNDYVLAKSEITTDAALFVLENFPQLIVQIIYGVHTGQANNRAIAWYIAIFITVFHTISQAIGVLHLVSKLPELREAHLEGYGKLDDDESHAIQVKV